MSALAEHYRANPAVVSATPSMFLARDDSVLGGQDNVELEKDAGGWVLVFERGWGDCPAGCIHRHSWRVTFDADGKYVRSQEQGEPLPSARR